MLSGGANFPGTSEGRKDSRIVPSINSFKSTQSCRKVCEYKSISGKQKNALRGYGLGHR